MRFPGVPFPMLGNPSLAGIVPIKQVAPHNVREGEWMELLEPLCWGQGRNRSGTLELSGRVGTGYLSFILASLLLLPGSLRPVQVTVFGFIFCWARLSPGRGGVGREKGRRNCSVSTIPAPLLLPCLSRLPPSSGRTWPWGQWGPDPCGTTFPGARPAGLEQAFLPSPFLLPQSIKSRRASELKQIMASLYSRGN